MSRVPTDVGFIRSVFLGLLLLLLLLLVNPITGERGSPPSPASLMGRGAARPHLHQWAQESHGNLLLIQLPSVGDEGRQPEVGNLWGGRGGVRACGKVGRSVGVDSVWVMQVWMMCGEVWVLNRD